MMQPQRRCHVVNLHSVLVAHEETDDRPHSVIYHISVDKAGKLEKAEG